MGDKDFLTKRVLRCCVGSECKREQHLAEILPHLEESWNLLCKDQEIPNDKDFITRALEYFGHVSSSTFCTGSFVSSHSPTNPVASRAKRIMFRDFEYLTSELCDHFKYAVLGVAAGDLGREDVAAILPWISSVPEDESDQHYYCGCIALCLENPFLRRILRTNIIKNHESLSSSASSSYIVLRSIDSVLLESENPESLYDPMYAAVKKEVHSLTLSGNFIRGILHNRLVHLKRYPPAVAQVNGFPIMRLTMVKVCCKKTLKSYLAGLTWIPTLLRRHYERCVDDDTISLFSLPPEVFQCINCQRTSAGVLVCSGCRVARYCSNECQRRHYKVHKKECKQQ